METENVRNGSQRKKKNGKDDRPIRKQGRELTQQNPAYERTFIHGRTFINKKILSNNRSLTNDKRVITMRHQQTLPQHLSATSSKPNEMKSHSGFSKSAKWIDFTRGGGISPAKSTNPSESRSWIQISTQTPVYDYEFNTVTKYKKNSRCRMERILSLQYHNFPKASPKQAKITAAASDVVCNLFLRQHTPIATSPASLKSHLSVSERKPIWGAFVVTVTECCRCWA